MDNEELNELRMDGEFVMPPCDDDSVFKCSCGEVCDVEDTKQCAICFRDECPACVSTSWANQICSVCLVSDPIYQVERRRIALEQALKDVKKDTDDAIEIIEAALKSGSILDIVQDLTRAITKINTTATMQLIINKVD